MLKLSKDSVIVCEAEIKSKDIYIKTLFESYKSISGCSNLYKFLKAFFKEEIIKDGKATFIISKRVRARIDVYSRDSVFLFSTNEQVKPVVSIDNKVSIY